MPSPIVLVNSSSVSSGADVSASSTPSITLADNTGVTSWSLSCLSTDETNLASTINTSLSGSLGGYTFAAPSGASALIFQSKVNNGKNINGTVDPTLTCTFGVYLKDSNGNRPAAVNETTEGNASFGWTAKLNGWRASLSTLFSATDRANFNSLVTPTCTLYSSGSPTLVAAVGGAISVLSGSVSAPVLPQASTWVGKFVIVKNNNLTGGVTVHAHSGDTIDGASTYATTQVYGCITFYSLSSGIVLAFPGLS